MRNTIKRFKKKERYTKISNESLQDETLTFGARGLLAYILSLPEDWSIYVTDLYNRSPQGRSSVDKMIKELKTSGHLEKLSLRNRVGQLAGTSWLAFDEVEPDEDIIDFILESDFGKDIAKITIERAENPINVNVLPNAEKPSIGRTASGLTASGKRASTNKTDTNKTGTNKTTTKEGSTSDKSSSSKPKNLILPVYLETIIDTARKKTIFRNTSDKVYQAFEVREAVLDLFNQGKDGKAIEGAIRTKISENKPVQTKDIRSYLVGVIKKLAEK